MAAIHNTKASKLTFEDIPKQGMRDKPQGLWYGVDDAWIEWCEQNMPKWVHPHNFEIGIDYSKMLTIASELELRIFTEKYSRSNPDFSNAAYEINWAAVAKKHSGIEISPYIWECRLEVQWYYSWDCASGCIWRKDAIKSITKRG